MSVTIEGLFGNATFSEDGRYRYELRRWWDASRPRLLVVMLNPSTANATFDDPTVRRCLTYAGDGGFGSLVVANAYAWRAADPADLERAHHAGDAIGPDNDDHLRRLGAEADLVWVAWGAHKLAAERELDVLRLLRARPTVTSGGQLYCRGKTVDGSPRHPLYVKRCTPLEPWP